MRGPMRQPSKQALRDEIEYLKTRLAFALNSWELAARPKPSMWQRIRGWFA